MIASSADNWDHMKERTSEAERFGHLTNLKGIVHVGKEGGGKNELEDERRARRQEKKKRKRGKVTMATERRAVFLFHSQLNGSILR